MCEPGKHFVIPPCDRICKKQLFVRQRNKKSLFEENGEGGKMKMSIVMKSQKFHLSATLRLNPGRKFLVDRRLVRMFVRLDIAALINC